MVFFVGIVFAVGATLVLAQGRKSVDTGLFKADIYYDVYYAVSDVQVDAIKRVSIMDTKNIGGKPFLVIRGTRMTRNQDGYILFDAITAILPSDMTKPSRASDR